MSLVKNLYKAYKNNGRIFILDIPHLEIPDQGITVLKGPSGAGKTSFFRILLGLEECKGIVWEFQGEDLAQLSTGERKLGVVFQSLELFPHMTARQNIQFAGKARGLNSGQIQKKVNELALQMQMSDLLDSPVQQLSGGEKQRVALMRALVAPVRFLFLDEPFSALDSDLKHAARDLIKQVIEKQKVPTLLITHDDADVQALADHIIYMDHGKIVTP